MKNIISFFALSLFLLTQIIAQDKESIAGSWEGALDIQGSKLRIIFNFTEDEEGKLKSTLDSPDQGAFGIPVDEITFSENNLVLKVNSIGGVYEGKFNEDTNVIEGVWKQGGGVIPLSLGKKEKEEGASLEPHSIWEGELDVNTMKLRLVLKVYIDSLGNLTATLDSPDQGAKDIPVSSVSFTNDSLLFTIQVVNGFYKGRLNETKDTASGTWTQMGNPMPLTLIKVDQVSEVKRPQEPKPPYPYNEEEVSYENKDAGITIGGTLTIPKGEEKFPAVLLITGSGPQNRDENLMGHNPFKVLADHLTRNNIIVLRVDDRGVGKSTGRFSGATTEDFVSDALAGVEYLKTRDEVDPDNIGLIGHSEGGLIAPEVSNKNEAVDFIVLLAGPGLPGSELLPLQLELILKASGKTEEEIKEAKTQAEAIYKIIKENEDSSETVKKIDKLADDYLNSLPEEEKNDPQNSREFFDQQMKTLMSPWFRYFVKYDPRPALREVDIPVLAVFGEKDLQVPPKENLPEIEKALKEGGNKNYKVVELENLNHLFQNAETGAPAEYGRIEETFSPKALNIISDWIMEVAGSSSIGK